MKNKKKELMKSYIITHQQGLYPRINWFYEKKKSLPVRLFHRKLKKNGIFLENTFPKRGTKMDIIKEIMDPEVCVLYTPVKNVEIPEIQHIPGGFYVTNENNLDPFVNIPEGTTVHIAPTRGKKLSSVIIYTQLNRTAIRWLETLYPSIFRYENILIIVPTDKIQSSEIHLFYKYLDFCRYASRKVSEWGQICNEFLK